jgi:BirA family biotin operon repressor/biotin-[acetyl-CoA-carboxylase] ligase
LYNISANTIFTGKSLVYLPTCHSTNEYAHVLLAEENPIEGTLIITPKQTAGRGQRGNTWEAEEGKNLTFSLIFKPSFLKVQQQFYLNIVSSLAVRDTVSYFLEKDLKVKWPNDIYLDNKKIAGILIQNTLKKDSIGSTIIGIGLNVNQESFSDKKAISMKGFNGIEYSTNEVLNKLLEHIEAYYLKLRELRFTELNQSYLSHLFRFNEEHFFKTEQETFLGTISGLGEDGRLIINTEKGLQLFSFKEIEFMNFE